MRDKLFSCRKTIYLLIRQTAASKCVRRHVPRDTFVFFPFHCGFLTFLLSNPRTKLCRFDNFARTKNSEREIYHILALSKEIPLAEDRLSAKYQYEKCLNSFFRHFVISLPSNFKYYNILCTIKFELWVLQYFLHSFSHFWHFYIFHLQIFIYRLCYIMIRVDYCKDYWNVKRDLNVNYCVASVINSFG